MRSRILGRTSLQVSDLGFGAWGIGKTSWIGADDEVSLASLIAARDAGITFFDTALVYGRGHSERLLAQAFGQSTEIVVASKVPPRDMLWPAPGGKPLQEAFPKAHVLDSLDRTLRNLGRETIDLYQFHVWSDEWADDPEWRMTIEEIRRSGKARLIGISMNDHQPENGLEALGTGLIDTVQVIYNIFDQSAEDRLFPYCIEHGIGVIARVPFDEGGLTGSIHPGSIFPEGDFRNRYFSGDRKHQLSERLQRLTADTEMELSQLPEVALRFCLSHPAVATVIPGMRHPHHVVKNVDAANRGALSAELCAKLRNHRWNRNFYAASAAGALDKPAGLQRIPARRQSLFGKRDRV